MTNKELQDLLKQHPDDIPVRLWADHGQNLMCPTGVIVRHVQKDKVHVYMLNDDAIEYDLERYEPEEVAQVLEIAAE